MIFKHREVSSQDLQISRLQFRTEIDTTDFERNMKGLSGERRIDHFLDTQNNEIIELRDIRLRIGNKERQFDSLIFADDRIYIIDSKYYNGKVRLEDGIFSINGYHYEHPYIQVERSIRFLEQFMSTHFKSRPPIIGHAVFTNPEAMYLVDRQNDVMTFECFKDYFKQIVSRGNRSNYIKMAQLIAKSHHQNSIFTTPLDLTHYQIKRGLQCPKCNVPINEQRLKRLYICKSCGTIHARHDVYRHLVNDFWCIYQQSEVKLCQLSQHAGFKKRHHVFEKYVRENYQSGEKIGTFIIR